MYGNPSGSHLSAGSFAVAAGTCLTPGPEGLLAFSAARPAGVKGRGRTIPVSSGCPASLPLPTPLGYTAGCSFAPLPARPPSSAAASQIPEMSRRGAGSDFFPAYVDFSGGALFHLSPAAAAMTSLRALSPQNEREHQFGSQRDERNQQVLRHFPSPPTPKIALANLPATKAGENAFITGTVCH